MNGYGVPQQSYDEQVARNAALKEEIERLHDQVQIRAGQVVDLQQTVVNRDAEIDRLRAELVATRAESALQPNYSCEHDGCAMREDSGYQEQARKYVDEYYKMKTELATLKALLRPFAALPVEALGQCQRHPDAPVYGINGVSFTAMDVLRIRAALGDESK